MTDQSVMEIFNPNYITIVVEYDFSKFSTYSDHPSYAKIEKIIQSDVFLGDIDASYECISNKTDKYPGIHKIYPVWVSALKSTIRDDIKIGRMKQTHHLESGIIAIVEYRGSPELYEKMLKIIQKHIECIPCFVGVTNVRIFAGKEIYSDDIHECKSEIND